MEALNNTASGGIGMKSVDEHGIHYMFNTLTVPAPYRADDTTNDYQNNPNDSFSLYKYDIAVNSPDKDAKAEHNPNVLHSARLGMDKMEIPLGRSNHLRNERCV